MRASLVSSVSLLAIIVGCSGLEQVRAEPTLAALSEAPPSPLQSGLRYNQIQQKSTHNSYSLEPSLFAQLATHGVRSLEVDIHRGHSRRPRLAQDWYVYHVDFPFFDRSSCSTLSECLREIARFGEAMPQHEVLTVFIDVKDHFGGAQTPAALDSTLARNLGRERIVSPGELRNACPGAQSVRDAVAGPCTWPRLNELRGKVLVVLTGGNLCEARSPVADYLAAGDLTPSLAFVAPDLGSRCPFDANGVQNPSVVFFNMDRSEHGWAPAVRDAGLVGRVYGNRKSGGLNESAAWNEAARAGAHILATDRVDTRAHPWASTNSAGGWPFRTFAVERPSLPVPSLLPRP